ncbi:MAG: universal stress protein [Deltaproteobacteria bacterium]|nr:universal stress protein [Deltaproteobacteria bacterium]MBW1920686.1 universal stress protein [Deltaproteobacteria bacterium]MBW1934737.1 universal stress protein [Deltaproteobacteria bacterium]MBW1978151.1 universal stress protein [Deltaproteobacteria bacterium]MBW2045779.1 universal stress protein [Deltaproteobacteria bacterium]
MAGRILLGFDESENAMRAVEFIAKFFTPDHAVTFFHVLLDTEAICDMNSPELSPLFLAHQADFCTLEDKKKDMVTRHMEKGKEILVSAGFSEANISFKVQTRKKGVARDIASEAKSGYDAVVLGRRGLSNIAEFFLGSISQKVLHASKDISVVLVT